MSKIQKNDLTLFTLVTKSLVAHDSNKDLNTTDGENFERDENDWLCRGTHQYCHMKFFL